MVNYSGGDILPRDTLWCPSLQHTKVRQQKGPQDVFGLLPKKIALKYFKLSLYETPTGMLKIPAL